MVRLCGQFFSHPESLKKPLDRISIKTIEIQHSKLNTGIPSY